MQAVREALPNHDIIYFGDTARVPYGEKSCETVRKYAVDNTEFLLAQGIDFLIIACNTATAYALDYIQSAYPIPVLGVIEPGARKAVETTNNGSVGVIGTKGTINSKSYEKKICDLNPEVMVFSKACPLFVPLVEEGYIDHPATKLIIAEYLDPLLEQGIDTLLLGCTHYPILKKVISDYCENDISIVDSAHTCAVQAKNMLIQTPQATTYRNPVMRYFVSDDPEKFQTLSQNLFNIKAIDLTVI